MGFIKKAASICVRVLKSMFSIGKYIKSLFEFPLYSNTGGLLSDQVTIANRAMVYVGKWL